MAGEELKLVQGSSVEWTVDLVDDRDLPEDLGSADQARLAVRESLGATAAILERSTAAGNLTIDGAASRLIASLTTPEASALPVGAFVGQAAIRFGDDDLWRVTDPFAVRIVRKGVTTP